MTTPEEKTDAALELILSAAGTSLDNYIPFTKDKMRNAMRSVMSSSYIEGSNACFKIMNERGAKR